jgi:hypothetical protein
MISILKIASPLPETPYAPVWDISIGVGRWENIKKIDIIRNWLINNETNIKNKYPAVHDGGTSLGLDSVTSRFSQYNLFYFINECPELEDLLNFLRKSWIEFVSKDGTPYLDLNIVCWFNLMHIDQQVAEHAHGAKPSAYLSGNMSLDDYHTSTLYRSSFTAHSYLPIKNNKGEITIFPTYVYHKSEKYKDANNPRLTIAFDLHIPEVEVNDRVKKIPFMNKSIFDQLVHQDD